VAEQCTILFVRSRSSADDGEIVVALRSLGFRVVDSEDLPPNEAFSTYHAVIVHAYPGCPLTMLAARLRAKPRFGHRVLIAFVPVATTDRQKREAVLSGFDLALSDDRSARDLAAAVLRHLRPYPEYRCLLRAPNGRRRAAA
jgi:hypothetical protein